MIFQPRLSLSLLLMLSLYHRIHSFAFCTSLSSGRRILSSRLCLSTQYTIDEPGVDPEALEETVKKYSDNLDRFLSSKPVAAHTQEAFTTLFKSIADLDQPIILDSGCGTGKSTVALGELYSDHLIVGVDRSLARLAKNGVYRDKDHPQSNANVFLVRAELSDFWRLWLKSSLKFPVRHYLLYPNPYPKKRRYQNRWYAHPSFPLIRQLQSEKIIVRSNWRAYLEDFQTVMDISNDKSPPIYKSDGITTMDPNENSALTNFEQKYFDIGETCYELILDKKSDA
jgi:tRNA G46 methylase TrmB